MNNRPIYDQEVFHKYSDMGGNDFVVQMIDLFIENISTKLREIHQGRGQSDAEAIKQAAHSIRSSAGNFGANAIMALTESIEAVAQEKNWIQLDMHIDELAGLLNAITEQFLSIKKEYMP